MSDFNFLPIIRIKPVPTDAQLAAEREAKYQALLRMEEADYENDWPIGEVTL